MVWWLTLVGLALAPAASARGIDAEPTIEQVLRAASVQARRHSVGLPTRGAPPWVAAIPARLSLRLGRHDERNVSDTWAFADADGTRRVRSEGRLSWRLEAGWDLHRWAEDPQAIPLARARARQQESANRLAEQITDAYFERRRLQHRYLRTGAARTAARETLWLRIAELTATLDRLTGGLFARAGVRWWLPAANRPPGPDSSPASSPGATSSRAPPGRVRARR